MHGKVCHEPCQGPGPRINELLSHVTQSWRRSLHRSSPSGWVGWAGACEGGNIELETSSSKEYPTSACRCVAAFLSPFRQMRVPPCTMTFTGILEKIQGTYKTKRQTGKSIRMQLLRTTLCFDVLHFKKDSGQKCLVQSDSIQRESYSTYNRVDFEANSQPCDARGVGTARQSVCIDDK